MKTELVKIKKFKCLEDFEQSFNGKHVLIKGDNGVGKSSILQFIRIAIGESDVIPENALGEGEVVFNNNGEKLICKVKIKDGKSKVTVVSENGMKDDRKGTLAGIVGTNSFDINEFVELSKTTAGKKKQVEMYKSFLPHDIKEELTKHEVNISVAYDERTELNKDITKLKGSLELHPLKNLPDFELEKIKPVDSSDLMNQLKDANAHNEKVSKGEVRVSELGKLIDSDLAKIAELEAQILGLKQNIESNKQSIKTGKEWLETNKRIDTSAIEKQIADSAEINSKADSAKKLLEERKKLEVLTNESGELTAKIESSREAIANAIRDMDSPIEGLTYDNDVLVWDGIPVSVDSLSTSEIIELGVRMKIAENPELGMLFIERMESVGTERFNLILDIANKLGWQIIGEHVERGKNLHFEFELV